MLWPICKGREIKMKKVCILSVLILLANVFLSGCTSTDDAVKEKIPVEVLPVKLGQVIQSIKYTGDIEAEFDVKVFSKVPDRIEKYYVDEGDYIAKGAPIARIFATTIEQGKRQAEAALAAARAQEANVKVEYERAERLNKENVLSAQQFDLVKTQYEAAKAQLEQAEAGLTSAQSMLKDATVAAPISGIIGKRYYEDGDMANMAVPLVSIVQMERVKTRFDATEEDMGKLALEQTAYITVRSFPDRRFEGQIIKISPVLDPLTRMASIEVLLDNKDKLLKPGMYADIEVITGTLENVIVVPRYATIESTTLDDNNGQQNVIKNYYVYIIEKDIALQKKLDVMYVNHVNLAVKTGIQVGDKLVVEGQNNLRDSSAVAVVKERSDTL
jgi:RND family efflux transporter MFP subunit